MSPNAMDLYDLGAMDGTKPYQFIGFVTMDDTRPCKFIRFGAMDVTKPYKIHMLWWMLPNPMNL
jgi:hypothetical protein